MARERQFAPEGSAFRGSPAFRMCAETRQRLRYASPWRLVNDRPPVCQSEWKCPRSWRNRIPRTRRSAPRPGPSPAGSSGSPRRTGRGSGTGCRSPGVTGAAGARRPPPSAMTCPGQFPVQRGEVRAARVDGGARLATIDRDHRDRRVGEDDGGPLLGGLGQLFAQGQRAAPQEATAVSRGVRMRDSSVRLRPAAAGRVFVRTRRTPVPATR